MTEEPDQACTPKQKKIPIHKVSDAGKFVGTCIVAAFVWFLRNLNRFDGLLTAIATGVIAVLTFYLVTFGVGQLKIMQRQIDFLAQDQRAWMGRPNLNILEPVVIENGEALFVFEISFENVGKAPTYETNIAATMVPIGTDWHETLRQECDGMSKGPQKRGWADQNVVVQGDKFIARPYHTRLTIGRAKEFSAIVVGCVLYGLLSERGQKVHRTGFAASVAVKKDLERSEAYVPLKVGNGRIERDELAIRALRTTTYAD